ncbi:DUF5677 domain-containing protein [Nocardia sp. NPDC050412]|uniref:DUF5677 domain-containing protein n=1 Tax=unclassified Nocardia TaxID=2637762 RepID=UPI003790AF76
MAVFEDGDVEARLLAVEAWIAAGKQVIVIGDLSWETALTDVRRMAVNYILRRQLEALDATVVLAKAGLGHLAVGFVRPALDELLWMLWVKDLPQQHAQELLTAMGRSDGIRSLMAQRVYVGDAVMQELWYPVAFLDAQKKQQTLLEGVLQGFRKQYGWQRGVLPSASWVAKQSGHEDLYDYLHAAASRALHFSMGEVLRHFWGDPHGKLGALKPEFREYRASFALYQLPKLFIDTASACADFFEDAGLLSGDEALLEPYFAAGRIVAQFAAVPLVDANEWNLSPSGRQPWPDGNPPAGRLDY